MEYAIVIVVSLIGAVVVWWFMRRENDARQTKQLLRTRGHLAQMIRENWISARIADEVWRRVTSTEAPEVLEGIKRSDIELNARQQQAHQRAVTRLQQLATQPVAPPAPTKQPTT